jgi:hypothetical protein
MITSMTGKPEPVTAADRRSFDLVTRWLVLSLPAAFLTHDIGEVRGNADLNSALAGLSDRIPLAARLAPSVATTDRQAAAAVGALTAGCAALAVRAVQQPAPGPATETSPRPPPSSAGTSWCTGPGRSCSGAGCPACEAGWP